MNMKKKLVGLIILIASAILSARAFSNFLKWAGELEIFDFDLDEDIDNENL